MNLTTIFRKVFGSKADRDMKAIRPTLKKILEVYPSIDALSDDELRAKSAALRQIIKDRTAEDEARIAQIREELEQDIEPARKEALAKEQDNLVKKVDDTIEIVLEEILPEAFAVMKSTARRFKENSEIRVKATEFDRELAAAGKEFVSIEGDEAVG